MLRQLNAGQAELHFDEETKTCNILPVEDDEERGCMLFGWPSRTHPPDSP